MPCISLSKASAAFKQELRIREKRFNIELGRRLQGVLRDNPNLDIESQEFQDIITKRSRVPAQAASFPDPI